MSRWVRDPRIWKPTAEALKHSPWEVTKTWASFNEKIHNSLSLPCAKEEKIKEEKNVSFCSALNVPVCEHSSHKLKEGLEIQNL